MTVHAGYDQIGDHCLGHVQPGTKALEEALIAKWGSTSDGIYNCRNVRGGSTKSAHAEGRAVDFHWTNEASGFQIANALVALNAQLGIQVLIFWDRIWSYPHADEGFRPYHGQDPHHSHLHVEQNWSGATELTLPEANRVLNPTQQPEPPHPPAALQEDDDVPWIANPVTDNDPGEYFVNGNTYTPLASPDEAQQLANSGFHVHDLEPLAWTLFKATATEVPHP
jgi:hypothetical protein